MILEMMEFCLTHNIFLFNGEVYQQCRGTAMGTCFAPSYANLFMGWWEEQVSIADSTAPGMERCVLWLWFIDDLFLIWEEIGRAHV